MTKPRYQEVKATDIPEVTDDDGTRVRLVCGHFWGKVGPVEGIAADPTYIDVSVPAGQQKTLVSGQPLEEPVAWYGPIVMNTQAELRRAFDELERGTFLKDGK